MSLQEKIKALPLQKADGWAFRDVYYPESSTHLGAVRFGGKGCERYTADQMRALLDAAASLAAEHEAPRWACPECHDMQGCAVGKCAIGCKPQAVRQEPGWKLVPVEPTPEMWDAAWKSIGLPYRAKLSLHEIKVLFDKFHAAMLAAAPQPPQPVVLTDEQVVLLWGHRSDGPSTQEIVSFARAVLAAAGITPPDQSADKGAQGTAPSATDWTLQTR